MSKPTRTRAAERLRNAADCIDEEAREAADRLDLLEGLLREASEYEPTRAEFRSDTKGDRQFAVAHELFARIRAALEGKP